MIDFGATVGRPLYRIWQCNGCDDSTIGSVVECED
jgi:ribosomal protein L37AE/L43A